ncbi:MAG: VWA domain-containing protein [Gammaproteobacteria bacterium]|nr:VWA domain-containing protein [Gammaproteobacteria bacterium]
MPDLMLCPWFKSFCRSGLTLVLGFFISFAFAGDELNMEPDSRASDVRVVIDISGSMKKSDPKNLRIPASKLLVGLLPEGSKAGIWTFGKYVNMLVPLGLADQQWKSKANEEIKKINSIALRTNIGKAMERATFGWAKPDPSTRRSLILLTDGVVDISRSMADNLQERERIVSELLPRLRRQGVTIHTIALSEAADKKLMQRLALETGGIFQTVISAADLPKAFLQTFDNAVPQDQVPLDDNYFSIDGSVDEFTALVFKTAKSPKTLLQTPSGKKLGSDSKLKTVSWLSAADYDLITVSKPSRGEWRLIADEDISNRVTVVSDLELVVDEIPRNILLGERVGINIKLLEEGKLLTKEVFLNLLDIKVTQQHVGGRRWSATLGGKSNKGMAEPGRFFARFGKTLVAGEHIFTIVADGKTFQRQSVQKIEVYEELVKVDVELDDASPIAVFNVNVHEDGGLLNTEKTSMTLELWDSDDQSQEVELEKNEIDHWLGKAAPFSGAGKYTYIVKVDGEALSGRKVAYQTKLKEILYHPEGYVPEEDASSDKGDGKVLSEVEGDKKPAPPETKGTESKALEAPEEKAPPPEKPPQESSAKKQLDATLEKTPVSPPESEDEAEPSGLFDEMSTGVLVALLIGVNGFLIALGYGGYRFFRRDKPATEQDSKETKKSKKESADDSAEPDAAKPESGGSKRKTKEEVPKKEIDEVDTTILGGGDASATNLDADSFDLDDFDEDDELDDEIEIDSDLESELDGMDDIEASVDETDLESIDLDDSLLDTEMFESAGERAESETAEIEPVIDEDKGADDAVEEDIDVVEDSEEGDHGDDDDEITDLDEDFDLDIDIDELLNDAKD